MGKKLSSCCSRIHTRCFQVREHSQQWHYLDCANLFFILKPSICCIWHREPETLYCQGLEEKSRCRLVVQLPANISAFFQRYSSILCSIYLGASLCGLS